MPPAIKDLLGALLISLPRSQVSLGNALAEAISWPILSRVAVALVILLLSCPSFPSFTWERLLSFTGDESPLAKRHSERAKRSRRTAKFHFAPIGLHSKSLLVAFLFSLFSCANAAAYEAPATPAARPFRFDTDTFSFANETVWNYANGTVQSDSSNKNTQKRDYTRRCFVVSRASVQFWKFARFDSKAKPLPPDELANRIRQVAGRSAWLPPLPRDQRIVFPGYASLREMSAADPGIFQANIGEGWPVYFRVGNAPIAMPLYRETEAHLNDQIFHDLSLNYPTIVWLYLFPSLKINHVVVIISGKADHGKFHYQVYDPNYTTAPKSLDYDAATRTFSYQPTFYFKGGKVDARAVYRGLLQ